ncbi:MAG: tetratricopeptide repeat protein, partial [Planctomycetota bacterium]
MIGIRSASHAGIGSAFDFLPAPNMLAATVTAEEVRAVIDSLEKTLAACKDHGTAFKIKYRMGLVYFRANMMNESGAKFNQIADDSQCPELIRACSLNMVGQISRCQGRAKDALKAFEELLSLLKPRLLKESKTDSKSVAARLWCSALFSRADIYETNQNYSASIAECDRLLNSLSIYKDEDLFREYAPLLNDRISRLYMRQGNLDKYIKIAEALITDYPEYHRRPLVELESECVKLLKSTSPNMEFAGCSFAAPAQLVALLRIPRNAALARDLCGKLDDLCEKYNNSYEGILLQYHYAWLLDAVGEKDKAAEMLAKAHSSNPVSVKVATHKKATIETVQAYAGIQSAIIAVESEDY